MPAQTLARTVFAALIGLLGASACLFDDRPACFDDGECGGGEVCRARRCVDPTPIEPADVEPLDGPAADAGPPSDGAVPDGALPDGAPPCEAVREVCNGRDDDCDGALDETAPGCDVPDHCHWRHRATHSYLFCDRAVSKAEAQTLCNGMGLQMATPESCDESDWLFATGNVTPSTVAWNPGERGRAWWLGFELGEADRRFSLVRIDGRSVADLEECWMGGEPDGPVDPDPILGEECVDLLYSLERDDWGWNDERCELNPENPVNALCETPCDPLLDADEDGEDACYDCDDANPEATTDGEGFENCPVPPDEGFPL